MPVSGVTRLIRLWTLLFCLGLGVAVTGNPTPAAALTPEEMLADPALEQRARDLSQGLRCLVCQNQSIDDSDAELARDLRTEVRRRLTAGESDADILDAIRDTYGDYVLLNPPISPSTWILWAAPVIILAGGALLVFAARRRDETPDEDSPLPARETTIGSPVRLPVPGRQAMALFSLAVGCSLLIYLALGRADLPDRPLTERTAEIAALKGTVQQDNADRVARLDAARAAVEAEPGRVSNWLDLAVAAAAAGRNETEATALRQAMVLTDDDPAIVSMLAEALSRAADGQITIPARALVEQALAANPTEPRALFLSGLAAYQDGDYAAAINSWQQLQRVSSADAPWMPLLADNIADAAAAGDIELPATPGPDAADIAAASEMSAEDRDAMIASMVDGLAARLADNPDDGPGWQRLARAYDVLGRTDAAQDAFVSAADVLFADADAQLAALQAIVAGNAEDRLATAAERLLARLVDQAPARPETLYLRGHFAATSGDGEAAREFWQQLLDRLPEDAPIASQLRAAIDAL